MEGRDPRRPRTGKIVTFRAPAHVRHGSGATARRPRDDQRHSTDANEAPGIAGRFVFGQPMRLDCRGQVLDLTDPVVMGVLNVTPDSFSDGGRYCNGGRGHRPGTPNGSRRCGDHRRGGRVDAPRRRTRRCGGGIAAGAAGHRGARGTPRRRNLGGFQQARGDASRRRRPVPD